MDAHMISARLKYIILSVLLVIASINFVRTTQDILESSKRLTDLRSEISSLEMKKSNLERDIEYKKTSEFIEERARNDLNMVKPGEKLLVFVGLQEDSKKPHDTADTGIGPSVLSSQTAGRESNPRLWFKLFFDK